MAGHGVSAAVEQQYQSFNQTMARNDLDTHLSNLISRSYPDAYGNSFYITRKMHAKRVRQPYMQTL